MIFCFKLDHVKVYEYRVVSARPDDLAAHLNELGEQGWRVTETVTLRESVVAVLMQELDSEPAKLRALVTLADRDEPVDLEADTAAVVGTDIEIRKGDAVAERWTIEAVATVEFYVTRWYATWTGAEERQLREEWIAGLPLSQIMRAHGRTKSAIMSRARQLGLDPR